MIIQIYEIQTVSEAEIMIELGVDHIGSVLVSCDDWQDNALKDAVDCVQSSGRKSSLIPLFEQPDTISQAIDYYQPDILHFCETLPDFLDDAHRLDPVLKLQQTIRERFPEIEIMRSIPIGQQGHGTLVPSLEFAQHFETLSDWFLTDTLLSNGAAAPDNDQPVNGFVGITGKTCDWDVARELVRRSPIPVILAGGIGPDNVAQGISHVTPAGVDSCTLTNATDIDGNTIRFQKDAEKVREMIKNARLPR